MTTADMEIVDYISSPASAPNLDDRTRALVDALNAAFGAGVWKVNIDPRYTDELMPIDLPIDVVLPLDQHEAAMELASAVEIKMMLDFKVRITIFVIAPEPGD